ncbi:hypothetical protein ACQP2X_17315 [Actinoplanes sp. CA-131856]
MGNSTRAEVLKRAQFWVDRKYTYSLNGDAPDPQGKRYRTDCSGLVSMAWRLPAQRNTTTFYKPANDVMLVSLRDLRPGDAFVRPRPQDEPEFKEGGHVELFVRWVNPKKPEDGCYVYSFNNPGETVNNPTTKSNRGNLGKRSWGYMNQEFRGIRYKKIVEDAPKPPPQPQAQKHILREPDARVAIVIGGAPFLLTYDEYKALGSPMYTSVPAGTFASMPGTIADGAVIRRYDDGEISIVAGGARYRFTPAEWAAMKNPAFVNIPPRLLSVMDSSPVDGTILRDHTNGDIYQVTGNAKYYLTDGGWDDLGRPGFTNVPPGFIAWVKATVPVEPTFLRNVKTADIHQVVGGFGYHLTPEEYDLLHRPAFTDVPVGRLNSLSVRPAEGTLLRDVTDGAVWRVDGVGRTRIDVAARFAGEREGPATVDVPPGLLAKI